MRTVIRFRSRAAALVAALAFVAASFMQAGAAAAQSCPSSGAGTTCFGGQFYCPVNNQCYSDPRPCSGNLTLDCSSCSCTCDTASFPCGGCTAASSTTNASCSGNASCPAGGVYANQCSVVGCPSGTTICPSPAPGRCVANRSCPAGTTWDVCTDSCGTPNVLLSPGWIQSGYIQINGDVKSTAGNLRLDAATGANQGDVYMANGKSIRLDGSGTTQLNIGNWGVGGAGANLKVLGAVLGNGFTTIAGDNAVAAGTIDTTQLCLGNGVNCRTSWPAVADFDPVYVNVTGDAMTGPLSISAAAAFGGNALTVSNNGQGGALTLSTNSTLNGVPALKVVNAGAGPGLDVTGGSGGMGGWFKGSGDNVALEAASYGHSGTNTLAPVLQVRRGTGSGIAPAVGMGGAVGFALQSDSAGSYSGGGSIGSVISSLSPWLADIVLAPATISGPVEKMRVGANGNVGIGTSAPDRSLTVANTTGANYVNVKDGTHELLMGVDSTGGIISVMTNHDLVLRAGANSEKMRVTAGGNVGVGASAPAAKLSVGGNGANVYATDLWVENNMHVQGNEAMAQGGGRGRLRVGTAWGYPGLYAEAASNGSNTDLVLGASSDHVLINAGSFGRPGASATLELWGSRLADTGSGVLSMRSGGGVVAFDGGDNVGIGTASPSQKLQVVGGGAYGLGVVCGNSQCFHFNNNGWIYAGDTAGSVYGGVGVAAANIWANSTVYIGGVGRSSWPNLSTTTSYCQFNAGSGAGWKACYCPSGYFITGWYGYNCKNNGGDWECSSSGPYGSDAVQVYHDSAGTAYVWAQCARVN